MIKTHKQTAKTFAGLVIGLSFLSIFPPQISMADEHDPQSQREADLSIYFNSATEIQQAVDQIHNGIASLEIHRGNVANNPASLVAALEDVRAVKTLASQIAQYGLLNTIKDTTSEEAQAHYQLGQSLETEVEIATSFVNQEMMAIPQNLLLNWLESEETLRPHTPTIYQHLSERTYATSEEVGETIEIFRPTIRNPLQTVFSLLQSDLGYEEITLSNGETIIANQLAYRQWRNSPNQEDRAAVANAYFGTLAKYRNVFGELYLQKLETSLAIARAEGFESPIDAEFYDRDGLPAGTASQITEAVIRNRESIREFLEVKAEFLDQSDVNYNLHLLEFSFEDETFSATETLNWFTDFSGQIGTDFQSHVIDLIADGQIDLKTTDVKDTYNWGVFWQVGKSAEPVLILNYDGSSGSDQNLVGGMLLLASYDNIPDELSPYNRLDPAVYSNGLISFGNTIYRERQTARATDNMERARRNLASAQRYYAGYVPFALLLELDLRLLERLDNGERPSGEEISAIYMNILREVYGEDIVIPESYSMEWAVISPHSYSTFEHFFWPASEAMGAYLQTLLQTSPNSVQRLVHETLLRNVGYQSYPSLLENGLDLASPEPYDAVFGKLEETVSRINQ